MDSTQHTYLPSWTDVGKCKCITHCEWQEKHKKLHVDHVITLSIRMNEESC